MVNIHKWLYIIHVHIFTTVNIHSSISSTHSNGSNLERKMYVDRVLLQFVLALCISKGTQASITADDVYSILAAKIDVISSEMSFLRQSLMSTKSELTTTKAELELTQIKLKLTQDEVKNVRAECGLVQRTTRTTAQPTISSTNTTINTPEEMTCCEVVKSAIAKMKAHQKQTKQDVENLIHNKVNVINIDLTSNRDGILSLRDKIDEVALEFDGYKNNSNKTLANLEQETKSLSEEMVNTKQEMEQRKREMANLKLNESVLSNNLNSLAEIRDEVRNVKEEMRTNTLDQENLERNLTEMNLKLQELTLSQKTLSKEAQQQQNILTKKIQNVSMSLATTKTKFDQLSENIIDLSNNHKLLAEKVQIQRTQVTEDIKTEMSKIEHCQSGTVSGYDPKRNPFPATYTIVFKKKFTRKPVVSLGSTMFDIDYKYNFRIKATVTEISEASAKVYIETWADTRVYRAGFSWMACPT